MLAVVFGGGLYVYTNRERITKQATEAVKGEVQKQFSVDEPTSQWVIVNKQRPLKPLKYEPTDLATPAVALRLSKTSEQMKLRTAAANALDDLFAAAKEAGHAMQLSSGYRPYDYQDSLYNSYVQKEGKTAADRQSARAGYSEHQTGWAADVATTDGRCAIETCFGDTEAGKWLAAHAAEYGFIIRYAKGTEAVTGYQYEPWHLRYVGKELAGQLKQRGNPPLETYFVLSAAAKYN